MLKRISIKDIDMTDAALPFGVEKQSLKDVEVVLTDEVTEVAGTVTDARAARPQSMRSWSPSPRIPSGGSLGHASLR
jgi:hypothetical protein